MFVCIYTQLPRLLCCSYTYAVTKYENGGSRRANLGDLEREKSLAFAGTRTPDRPGRNAGTGTCRTQYDGRQEFRWAKF